MKFISLSVNNVGVFRGEHVLDLAPHVTPNLTTRSIVVVSGHNGSGKSTLFRAASLALHGPQSLLSLPNNSEYNASLRGLTHRYKTSKIDATGVQASITLRFQFVRSGRPLDITVERSWEAMRGINQALRVLCNGVAPDIEVADRQTWINDLISPGIGPLCFFDAEHLEALSSPDRYNASLGGLVRRLFGIDLVEKLRSDLSLLTLQQVKGRRLVILKNSAKRNQDSIDEINREIVSRQIEEKGLEEKLSTINNLLKQQQSRLAAEGGDYSARLPLLQQRLDDVKRELGLITNELRDLSAGLLPFSLAPDLCQALSNRLTKEAQMRQQLVTEATWQDRIEKIRGELQNDQFWAGLNLQSQMRAELRLRIEKVIDAYSSQGFERQRAIHQVSESLQVELQEWLAQAVHTLPARAKELSLRSRALRIERKQLDIEMRRAPDESALKPIHAEITRLEKEREALQKARTGFSEKTGALQFRLAEKERERETIEEEIGRAHSHSRQADLADKSKLVLRAYQDALVRQRTQELEIELVTAFNILCSKERLIDSAHIDPDDFTVGLRDAKGHALSLADLSAGERHLYVLALLWALRKVGKLDLPLFIDTPLARLDAAHRDRILRTYLSSVSSQVVLFTTDAEMDTGLLAEAEPSLSRVYRLKYDPKLGETQVA